MYKSKLWKFSACLLAIFILLSILSGCRSKTKTSSSSATQPTTQSATTQAQQDQYNTDNFKKDGSFIDYYVDGSKASKRGVDISTYNKDIDFNTVKESGIDFVMVRLGGRGYGERGDLYLDDTALDNIKNAKEAGLLVGAYFFSQAITDAEAKEEADFCMENLADISLDFPLAIDWENIHDEKARTDVVNDDDLTIIAKAFCNEVRSKGGKPMIYSKSYDYSRYDKEIVGDEQFWFAEYRDKPSRTTGFGMWQYSERGDVNGISGKVDLNLLFEE